MNLASLTSSQLPSASSFGFTGQDVHSCLSAPQLSLSSTDITELLTAHVFHHHFSNDYHYHTAIKFSVTASYLADFFPIFKKRDHRRRGKNEGLGGTEGCRVEEEGEVPGLENNVQVGATYAAVVICYLALLSCKY